MDTNEWLRSFTDDHTKTIAARAGISDRTLRHQMQTSGINVENVIRIANAYDQHPLRVLINMGIVDESWANAADIEGALRRADDEQLTDEILRRMKVAPNPDWDEPVGDLAAKRAALSQSNEQGHPSPDDEDDGTVREWTDHDHAADSSPDEDALREEEGADPFD